MKQLKIYDDQFSHAFTMANGGLNIKAKNFEWSRTIQGQEVAFITESWFNRVHLVSERVKVAILIEPMGFAPQHYHWIKANYNIFDMILTHEKTLLSISPKFVFYPYAGSWIYEKDHFCYPKSKNISIVASGKNELEGHRLRHEVVSKIKNVDVYGREYNKLDYLLPAYKDYRFTIVIENNKYDYWFTEKLTNPLFCGCVPIYWGCPSISKFFKEIIQFNSADDLNQILTNFKFEEEYKNRMSSIQSNYWEARKYEIAEDWIWVNIVPLLTNRGITV